MYINVGFWLDWLGSLLWLLKKNVLNPWNGWKLHYCGKNFWQTIFLSKNGCVKKKHFTFFLEKSCLSAFPKRIRLLMQASLKNGVSTNVRDTGPSEGPIHLTLVGLFPRVHNCSNFFQSWSWSQKKKETSFTKATCSFSFSFPVSFSFSFYVSFSFPVSFSSSSPSSSSFSFSRSLYCSLVLSLFLSLITPLLKKKRLRWKR